MGITERFLIGWCCQFQLLLHLYMFGWLRSDGIVLPRSVSIQPGITNLQVTPRLTLDQRESQNTVLLAPGSYNWAQPSKHWVV